MPAHPTLHRNLILTGSLLLAVLAVVLCVQEKPQVQGGQGSKAPSALSPHPQATGTPSPSAAGAPHSPSHISSLLLPASPMDEDEEEEQKESGRRNFYLERWGHAEGPGHVEEDHFSRVAQVRAFLAQHGRAPLGDVQAEAPGKTRMEAVAGVPAPAATAAASGLWKHLGPAPFYSYPMSSLNTRPGAGRLRGIYLNRVDPRILYTFSEGAGLWRCLNADPTQPTTWIWERIAEGLATDATKVWVNAASPEALFYGASKDLYRSTDHGSSWAKATTFTSAPLSLVGLDTSTVLAATSQAGVQRSLDGGLTWTLVPVGDATKVTQVLFLQGSTVIASGMVSTTPALYYSADNGLTWAKSTLNSTVSGALSLVGGGQAAYISNQSKSIRTLDGGQTWNEVPLLAGQTWPGTLWDCDPASPDVLIANGGVEMYRSLDGGATWEKFNSWSGGGGLPFIHADQHSGAFSEIGTPYYYSGTDGGLALVSNYTQPIATIKQNELTWIEMRFNATLGNPLCYAVGSSGVDTTKWILGMQDNATGIYNGNRYNTGDTLTNVMHPTNVNLMLAEGYSNNLARTTDGGAHWTGARNGITTTEGWSTHLWLGSESDTVYESQTTAIYRSIDFGLNWVPLALPTLTNVRGFAASKSNPKAIAFAAKGASSWGFISYDLGTTWIPFGAAPGGGLPWSLTFDPQDDHTLLATINSSSAPSKIIRSTDGGVTWVALDGITSGWPSGAVPDPCAVHPTNRNWYIVGTSLGVFQSLDAGQTWLPMGTSFPLVDVTDMFIPPDGSWIRVVTWGMGMWDLDLVAPAIATQPQSQTVVPGTSVTFSVTATGPNLTYQWQRNGSDILDATSSSYTLASPTAADSGASFSVTVSNTAGSVTSSAAVLTVLTAPAITTQPQSQTVTAGTFVTFSVVATGTSPTYQWSRNGTAISGATASSYTLISPTTSDSGAAFTVTISNAAGSVTSSDAILTVTPATTQTLIVIQPSSILAPWGGTATFEVSATGSNLTYQWQRDGSAIPGATNFFYTTAALGKADNGAVYSVVVTGALGTVTSQGARLTLPTLDLNQDGVVDLFDVLALSRFMGTTGLSTMGTIDPKNPGIADLNGDGRVDALDLAILLANR